MKLAVLVASSVLLAALGTSAHADRQAVRQAVIQHFDRNHDGVLQPKERRQAARALRRIAKRLVKQQHVQQARQHQAAQRQQLRNQRRHARMIRRFDVDGDGNLGPGELPPVIADELRPLDQDGDGWLQSNELP